MLINGKMVGHKQGEYNGNAYDFVQIAEPDVPAMVGVDYTPTRVGKPPMGAPEDVHQAYAQLADLPAGTAVSLIARCDKKGRPVFDRMAGKGA